MRIDSIGRRRAFFVSLLIVVAVPRGALAIPSNEIVARASRSVVVVTAENCAGPSRTGTGFVWREKRWIVTALHIVSGCKRLSVRSQSAGALRTVRLLRVSKQSDLALLGLDEDLPGVEPLSSSSVSPEVDDVLKAVGYQLGAPTLSDVPLRVALGSSALRDMLPESVRKEISAAGSPGLSLTVLRLDGHLLPGLSGAPILESAGLVVGVGDGGLENGAASISFGIPVRYLAELEASTEPISGTVGLSFAHFSAELEAVGETEITCGGIPFRRARTRAFDEVVVSSDDPRGAHQLLQALSMTAPIHPGSLRFDIYENQQTGAVVVVPEGMQLTSGARCQGAGGGGMIIVKVGGAFVDSPGAAQNHAFQFRQAMKSDFPTFTWQVNPAFSYWGPLQRFDGLVAQRTTAVGMVPPPMQRFVLAFDTLMTRGRAFVGVGGLNLYYTPPASSPNCPTQACKAYRQHMTEWATTVLGVHLSTFPPQ